MLNMSYRLLWQEGEEVEVGSFDERYTVDQVLSLIARGRKSHQSTLRQVLKDNLFNNLKVLLHFMFVSVFGMSANQMIIDKNCTNNKLYEYFICEYVPKFRKDHIWFKYKKVLEILRKKQKAHHFFIIKAICDRHGIRRKGRYDASYMYRRQMPPQTDRQIILQAQDDSDIIQHLDCYDALQRTCVVTTTSKAREHRSNAREPRGSVATYNQWNTFDQYQVKEKQAQKEKQKKGKGKKKKKEKRKRKKDTEDYVAMLQDLF
eukprot:766729_1